MDCENSGRCLRSRIACCGAERVSGNPRLFAGPAGPRFQRWRRRLDARDRARGSLHPRDHVLHGRRRARSPRAAPPGRPTGSCASSCSRSPRRSPTRLRSCRAPRSPTRAPVVRLPKRLTFTLDRRTDVGGLLPAVDDAATYTVKAVPAGGAAVTLVNNRSILGAEDAWTAIDPVELDPSDLTVGRNYSIEVATTFQSGVTVIGTGDVDYDNVVLRARGGGGGGGGGGNAGPGGGLTTRYPQLAGSRRAQGQQARRSRPGARRTSHRRSASSRWRRSSRRVGPKVTEHRQAHRPSGRPQDRHSQDQVAVPRRDGEAQQDRRQGQGRRPAARPAACSRRSRFSHF